MTLLDSTDGPPGVWPHRPNLWNPATGRVELQRTANLIWGAVTATAGYTVAFIPTAGKRFRLMGFNLRVPSNAAWASSNQYLQIRDALTATIATPYYDLAVTTGPTDPINIKIELPGNGYLSALADNVLQVRLNTSLTTGSFHFIGWGCEE